MSSSPFDEADEADVTEQQRPVVDDDDGRTAPPSLDQDQANEADVLEQGAEVGEDEEY